MKNIFYLLILFLSLDSFGQVSELKVITGANYQISYSKEWKLDESGRANTEFFLFYAPTAGKFGDNINLMIQNLEGMNLTLESYTELSHNQIKANGTLLSSERKSKNGIEFQELSFQATLNSKEIKFFQHYYVIQSKAYILTFTAIKEEYDAIFPLAKSIFDTFEIK